MNESHANTGIDAFLLHGRVEYFSAKILETSKLQLFEYIVANLEWFLLWGVHESVIVKLNVGFRCRQRAEQLRGTPRTV